MKTRAAIIPILALSAALLAGARPAGAGQGVLVLQSYNYGNAWARDIMRGIDSVLRNIEGVEIAVEFMDAGSRPEPQHLQRLRQAYAGRYHGYRFRAIIACDDDAFRFALENRATLFPRAPIVFCGVNDFQDSMLAGHARVTGVVETPDIEGTLALALRLHPKTRQIAVVHDRTMLGLATRRLVDSIAPRFQGRVGFHYLSDLTAQELGDALAALPRDAIVLYLSFRRDKAHRLFTADESAALVTGLSPVPVYTCWDIPVGAGAVGGKVIGGYDQGRAAATMAQRILSGDSVQDIPVVSGSRTWHLFDYVQLRRFGLRPGDLPEQSEVLNQPPGMAAHYWWLIWGTVVFLAAETLLIALLLINRRSRFRVQEELRGNQERLLGLLEGIEDALFVHDEGGHILYCNKAACRRLRYTQAELVRMNMRNVEDPEGGSGLPERIRHLLAEGHGAWEGIHLAKDGRRIPVDIHASVVEYEGRRAILVVARDIARRRRAERALRESEERYRQIAESIDQVFWVTALHPERAQYVSPAFEKIWGFPPAKLYRNARAWTDCIVPSDRARVVAAFDACVRGETPHFHAEFRILRPDGSIRWVLDNGVPIRNERGQVYRISGITKDVTERKQAEAALRESEERLGLAIEGAELGMWDRDIRTGEAVYNDRWAEMLGYPLDEIEPTTEAWQELIHPDDLARVRQALDAHFAGETPFYEAEYRMRAKSGAWKWILARGRVVQRDADGIPLRITGTHLDVTARKQAEEERVELELQVQHAQKLESLGVLAGGIAHDFNNLLVAIVGNADLALDALPPGSQAHRNIAEIETAAQRAAELCRQMLAYSGKGRFVVAPMQINDIVEEITHLLAVSISKKATVRYNLAEELPAIEVDPTQVRQVIMNLITNASEALGDEDGVIAVVTGMMECNCDYLSKTYLAEGLAEGPYVYLDVTDTGCGMDNATRESIFDPFFTTKFTGRGLGLAAVLGIVRGHKGAIRVFTEPGRGTSFRILFPAADEPAQPLAREHEPPADADKPWRGSGTVLLVDDEETIRIVGSRMLEHLGFQTLTADNGVEALDLYRQRAEDIVCVLLDLTMPHMDGEETFRELRALNPDVRVILSSGYDQQEVARRFAGKGMAGFLQKPFRSATLADKLREVIDAPSA